jgi:hypothetical protein
MPEQKAAIHHDATPPFPNPAVAVNSHSLDFPEDGMQHNAYSVHRHAFCDNFEEEHNIDTSVSELAMYQCIQTDSTEQELLLFKRHKRMLPRTLRRRLPVESL